MARVPPPHSPRGDGKATPPHSPRGDGSVTLPHSSRGDGSSRKLLLLGLGNVLCGDDGLGVAAVERLVHRYRLPPGAEALDGGTLGLALLTYVSGADDLVLLDAIRTDAPAGTLVRLEGDSVAPAVRERLSVHQVGVADLMDGLHLVGAYPRRVVLVGLVPETLELGLGFSAPVAAGLDTLVDAAVAEARDLGYPLTPGGVHAAELARSGSLAHRALGLS